ncbi:hypothetical protein LO772_00445 [Yinghuangia sp. ASG 101]|uniref:hypothetical protein n=1 Tax=Yinghuangia sp. ASG 101 TaxID=2896848 RepID=UPI001E655316|nr:hypothetical protein [Yinghuangia sp. ASG 101]UGQ12115.1 hypothetical protein LO772_00445 [Yinghuangia sp. ASG 101]
MRKGELSTLLSDGQETRQNVRDTAAKVEQAVTAGADTVRAAIDRAREESVRVISGDLTALRADVRAARNSAATAAAVQELRQDVRELRTLIQPTDPTAVHPTPPPQVELPEPAPQVTRDPNPDGAAPSRPPADSSPNNDTATAAQDPTTEAAPVSDTSASPTPEPDPAARDEADSPAEVEDVIARLREIVAGSAYEELRRDVAQLRDELAALRDTADGARGPQPPAAAGEAQETPVAADAAAPTKEHDELLLAAARISSAPVLCHRDTWEFLIAKAGAHPHFRHPHQITAKDDGRVEGDLSGRSLIAVLSSLWKTHRTRDDSGDWALAQGIYQRIADRLTNLATDGKRVSIVLDDRDGAPDPDSDPT